MALINRNKLCSEPESDLGILAAESHPSTFLEAFVAVRIPLFGLKSKCRWGTYVGAILVAACFATPVTAQESGEPAESLTCDGRWTYPDPHCFELIPRPEVSDARGIIRMERVQTPFGVAVSPDGRHRYRLVVTLAGLPEPASLGPYSAYVAWVTTPRLTPMVKLGEVGNGRIGLEEVDFNRFMVMVTAETSGEVEERTGKLVMRGRSPSDRMEAHDLMLISPLAAMAPSTGGHEAHAERRPSDWDIPPMHPAVQMPPGLMALEPQVRPFLPSAPLDSLPEARPRELIRMTEGDTLRLEAGFVRRTIRDRSFVMLGFNGQYPGPLLDVPQGATIIVDFRNQTEMPTAVHWHGLRQDNRFDGVPGVTQDAVEPGASFEYRVFFPDAGLYWYHPHHREDVQQDLGLYGNMLVRSPRPEYYSPVNREEVLMLDDLLLGEEGLVPYGRESANYMLMGRFGNVMLVNGEPDYTMEAQRGEIIRFFLTNVSNTRTFNLSLGRLPIKVVGSDVGLFEREVWAESVVIAPAERYIIEVQFPEAGQVVLTNRVQAIDHRTGRFFQEVDTLAIADVAPQRVQNDHSEEFNRLRQNDEVVADIDRYRAAFERPVDHELLLTLEADDLAPVVRQLMRLDPMYFNPVEWSGTMPMMNWASTGAEVNWLLRDPRTGNENMDIAWRFEVGDIAKIRITNDRDAFHAMQHPVHFHGQRFLILEQDGVRNDNLVWKDTMLLPVGSSADILLEITNPGRWMVHCHIAEHLESGMKMVFTVDQ
ncbi:MAG: suppressor of ftsI [Rhodothermales bacterium]|jgi:suppressor of ftsI